MAIKYNIGIIAGLLIIFQPLFIKISIRFINKGDLFYRRSNLFILSY